MTPESKLDSLVAMNIELMDKKEEGGMAYQFANLPKQYLFCELAKDTGDFMYFHSRIQVQKSCNNCPKEFGLCLFELVNEGGRRRIASVGYVLALTENGVSVKPLKDAPNMSPIAVEVIEKTIVRYNSRPPYKTELIAK